MQLSKLKLIVERAKIVKHMDGVSYFQQLCDLIRITFGNYLINHDEYYYFRIYSFFKNNPKKAKEYIGVAIEWQLSKALNERVGALAADDKRVLHLVLANTDVPLPALKATYLPAQIKTHNDHSVLNTISELREFLLDKSNYPFYAKAASSEQALHVVYAADLVEDSIIDGQGNSISVDDFISEKVNKKAPFYKRERGWIFQEPLKQNPEITKATGVEYLSTARVVVLRSGETYVPIRAVWKICSAGNTVDNFRSGTKGNTLASIDIETGKVKGVLSGYWPGTSEKPAHLKDSPLQGFTIPDWQKAMEAVITASSCLPFMTILHWDVAFTENGPALIEVNDYGGCNILQLHDQGIIVDQLRDALLERQKTANKNWQKEFKWVKNI